jgi:hypothetical protein
VLHKDEFGMDDNWHFFAISQAKVHVMVVGENLKD